MSRKRQRLALLALGLTLLAGATAMVLVAFNDNLVFFFSPTELKEKGVAADRRVRIGGLVELHSVVHNGDRVGFRVTDGKTDVPVTYRGVLPDLFREGQGVVAEGTLTAGGQFAASEILAKHDERYMPPEVVAALKKSGHWQEGAAAAAPPLQAVPDPPPLAGPGITRAGR